MLPLLLALTALLVVATGSHSAPSGWSQPQAIGAPAGAAALAASETDSQGRVYAAWVRDSAVMLSTWQNGGWGVPQVVSPAGANASDPTVAVDDSGRVLVAWSGGDGDVYATVVGSGTVANLSRSGSVVSDLPRAGFVPSLGFVVLWREMVVPGSQGCHYGSGDDRSTLDEAHLSADSWTDPAVAYDPPSAERGPTWICGVYATADRDGSLYVPVETIDSYQVRGGISTVTWNGSGWTVGGPRGGGGEANLGGIGFPGGTAVAVVRVCGVGCGLVTSTGVPLADDPDWGGLATATAGATMLATWDQASGLLARSSDDGLTWTESTAITSDIAAPLAATGAAGHSFFVAYAVSGELRSVHLGTPPAGTFGPGISPTSRSLAPGSSGTYAVSVDAASGFADDVAFSIDGLPPGTTGTFSPNPARSTSTLTVNVGASTRPGTYPLTVTGTSKGTSHTVQATLVVPPPDFAVAVSPSSRTITAGSGTSFDVSIAGSGGFAGSVSLAVSGVPGGASASFSANPASSSSALAVLTTGGTAAGTYTLTVTGTSGALTHTAQVMLVVEAPPAGPAFALSASPASWSVRAGSSAVFTVSVTATGGFAGPVSLMAGGLPAGTAAAFVPNPAGASSTLTVTTSAATPAGTYPLTVTGTSGTLSRSLPLTLIVQAAAPPPPTTTTGGGGGGGVPPDLTVAIAALPPPTAVGDAFTYTFTIRNLSSVGSVRSSLTVTLPTGVTLAGAKVNRGPGCTRTGQVVSCDLDFFPAAYSDTVLLYATVTQPGELTVTARLDSTPTDANPANDTASLTMVLRQTGATTTTTTTTTAKPKAKPRITILSATPTPAHRVLVRVRITNWPIYKTARAATPPRGGCWLIRVDGKPNVYSRSPSTAPTTKLPPGTHHITAELLKDNQHPLTPRARSNSLTIHIR